MELTRTAPRTIRRNATRVLAAIRETHTDCRVFTLNDNFAGKRIPADMAWDYVAKFGGNYSITINADGVVTITLHSNAWYTLRVPAATTDPRDAAVRATLAARFRGAVDITDEMVAAVLAGLDSTEGN